MRIMGLKVPFGSIIISPGAKKGSWLMDEHDSAVFLIDDDPSFRRSCERLLSLAGYRVESFPSAKEFLERGQPDIPACLVTDLRMPGMNGIDLQSVLANAGWEIPLIFVTGHGDVSTSVRAMKAGAIEFLTKPFQEHELLTAVAEALQRDRARRHGVAERAAVRERYNSLTLREREVMQYVVAGMLNKQTAAALDVGEKTIKFHRAHIMEKMNAGSLAALVKMAIDLGGF
jgi:FixJ family two-component response regulator